MLALGLVVLQEYVEYLKEQDLELPPPLAQALAHVVPLFQQGLVVQQLLDLERSEIVRLNETLRC